MTALLESGEYPSRNPAQNIADLKAQVAANEKGARELAAMVGQYGLDVVRSYMQHVQDNAEESVRRVITRLRNGAFTLPLDNGARISVAIRVDAEARSAAIDFSGTSAQLENNFNAPTAVCMAAVLYVFRTLVADEIPLNAGCMKPLKVIIPERSMLNPRYPAAVVAGNVETSQCVTDALYGALGLMAFTVLAQAFYTGNALLAFCDSTGPTEVGVCLGLIVGVADVLGTTLASGGDFAGWQACRPNGVTSRQMRDVVTFKGFEGAD
jgi:5-oxoprolinase (ATP-hydrolysing)